MSETTWYTLIEAAARGASQDRAAFVHQYEAPIRAYLMERWNGTAFVEHIDDTVQDVFVECFRIDGVIDRFDSNQPGGFRAFLYGAVRNVARYVERRWRMERKHIGGEADLDQINSDESSLSKRFDRAWAKLLMKQASERQRAMAATAGSDAQRRVELLQLRFQENLPIRDIARRWDVNPAVIHREYAKARQEFQKALKDVVQIHSSETNVDLERKCRELLDLL